LSLSSPGHSFESQDKCPPSECNAMYLPLILKNKSVKKKYSPIKKWASRMKTERSWEYWALFMVKCGSCLLFCKRQVQLAACSGQNCCCL
ncbi:unnamed protein product, partial [Prunus brigantina]